MSPVFKARELVSFGELPVKLVPVGILEGRKLGPLETVLNVIDLLETGIYQVLCRNGAPCAVPGND